MSELRPTRINLQAGHECDDVEGQYPKAAEAAGDVKIVTAPPGLIEAGQKVTRKAAQAAKGGE